MAEARHLKVGVDWSDAEILSEPYVVMTMRGYAPVVDVQSGADKLMLYISAKSLSTALEPLVQANGGKFAGLKLRLKKESDDKMAGYVVERV